MRRPLRADLLLAQNIRSLLHARRVEAGALAAWCGHQPPWISKILKGERGAQVKDLGKIADFFGLTVAQLFQHGISPLTERRHETRRSGGERRTGEDRRQPIESRLHPQMQPRFPERVPDGAHDSPKRPRIRLDTAEDTKRSLREART